MSKKSMHVFLFCLCLLFFFIFFSSQFNTHAFSFICATSRTGTYMLESNQVAKNRHLGFTGL